MKQGRKVLLVLTLFYLVGQIAFNILLSEFHKNLVWSVMTGVLTVMFVVLFSRGLVWAKWTLSVVLVLSGIVCMVMGFIIGPIGTVIGMYNMYFALLIHRSSALIVFMYQDQINATYEIRQDDPGTFYDEGQVYHFPSLVKRYKAMFIDTVLVVAVLIIIMFLTDGSSWRTEIMVFTGLLIILTYEPLLTVYSGTVGQRIMKIKVVRNDDPFARISLLNAYVRWFTKAVLGWISFITINFNPRHRAMHDLASDSVVING